MKVVYMECTLKLLAKKDPSTPKALEEMGTINYVGDIPYLVIKIEDENVVVLEN